MPQISLNWDTVKAAYPKRPLTGPLKVLMDRTPGTPCCVQMSHALNAAGCAIGAKSNRRTNESVTTALGKRNYMLAVDEMKWFLERNFGLGDEISKDDNGKRRTLQGMKDVLDGRTGILVFFDLRFGSHTELWDVNRMHQRDIVDDVFNEPKVFFWDVMITATA